MGGLEEFLSGTIRLSAPLILAALGEVLVQRAGVINIGIEAMMLASAFAGFAVGSATGSVALGLLAAACSSVAVAVAFALICITNKADQIVVATGLNIGLLGLTGVLNRGLFGIEAALTGPRILEISIPVLSEIPLVGPVLFQQTPLAYVCPVAALGIWFFLRSPMSLGLRACGSRPDAADAAGVRVDLTRWSAVIFGGLMAGLAGAFLSMVQANTFTENMTSGRGFIALAVVIFGRWSPVGILFAGLLFGAADEAQFWLQAHGSVLSALGLAVRVPYQLLLALPYIVTLIALTASAGKYRGPRMLGKPYVRST